MPQVAETFHCARTGETHTKGTLLPVDHPSVPGRDALLIWLPGEEKPKAPGKRVRTATADPDVDKPAGT